ncbi:MAG TPA: hypothetical protein VND43_02275 [Burkholderiales bacterium]|nr:hypothetical protein [Burkholderiales bacterium]
MNASGSEDRAPGEILAAGSGHHRQNVQEFAEIFTAAGKISA